MESCNGGLYSPESLDKALWSWVCQDTIRLWPRGPVASIISYCNAQQEKTRRIRMSLRYPEMMLMAFKPERDGEGRFCDVCYAPEAKSYVQARARHPDTNEVERKDLSKVLKLIDAMEEVNDLHRAIVRGNTAKANRILSKGAR